MMKTHESIRWRGGFRRGVMMLSLAGVFGLTAARTSGADEVPDPGILLAAEGAAGREEGAGWPTILEPGALHHQALRAMPAGGWARFTTELPEDGRWSVWLRYQARVDAATRLGFGDREEAGPLALPATGGFTWVRLGDFEAAAGPVRLRLGGGEFQADALWLGRPGQTPPSTAPRVDRPRVVLPPLEHRDPIREHPRWIFETVRVAYAHWEREKPMPLDDWARTMKRQGATALLALGNVPDIERTHTAGRHAPPGGFAAGAWKPDYEWVREYAETVHRHGLRLTLYSEHLSHLDEVLAVHPEWREKNEAGGNYGQQPCFCSPYWDAFIERMEGLAAAGADGIMMDMLGFGNPGGCRNRYCLETFAERFGVPAPDYIDPLDPVFQRWIDFQSFVREEALLRLTRAVHAVNPDFAVFVNQHRGWHYHLVANCYLSTRLKDCVDGIFEEIGWEDRHAATRTRPFGFPLRDSFQNAFLRTRRGTGQALQWYLTASSPEAELRARNFNMLAHGVIPAPLTGPPLEWRYGLWDDIREREEAVLGAEALPWMGLLYFENTLAWRYAALEESVAARPYVESVWGAFQVAAEERIPTDILCDWHLTPENLARYRVIVLPNAAALSEKQVEALRNYVQAGGGLVATFETSLCDETALPREDFGLADVFGVSWVRGNRAQGVEFSVPASGHPILEDARLRWMGDWRQGADSPLPAFKITTGRPETQLDFAVVEPGVEGEQGLGRTLLYAPMGVMFTPESKLASGEVPALVAREFGAGRVVYFPADLTRGYFLKNSPATQALLARSLRWAGRVAPPVEIEGNYQVEATFFTRGKKLYVHLLNDVGGFGRASPPNPETYGFRKDVVPLIDLPVWVDEPVRGVRLLPGNEELLLERSGGRTRVILPRLELHAVLVLERE